MHVEGDLMSKVRSLVVYLSLAILLFVLPTTSCPAQHFFDLVQEGTGDVLATLELFAVPAVTLTDVAGLTFTSEGDALFGFGVGAYSGVFDQMSSGPIDVSPWGELHGPLANFVPTIEDLNPPASSTDPGFTNPRLILRFQNVDFTASTFGIIYGNTFAQTTISAKGNWLSPIPEPSGVMLSIVGVLFGTVVRRRR